MVEFSFTPDIETPNIDSSEFSFTPDSNQETVDVDVKNYNGTSLINQSGEDAKPYSKLDVFLNKLFTFDVKSGTEVEEKMKANPRVQALEKVKEEGFDDVKWSEPAKFATKGFLDIGKKLTGSSLKAYGDWAMDNRDTTFMTPEEINDVKYNNFQAQSYIKVGEYIEKLWDLGIKSDLLKEDEEIFKGSFVDNPSMTRTLSLGASAIPSVVFYGAATKVTGSSNIASSLLAGVDNIDLYFEARKAGEDQNKSLGLFLAGTAGTAMLEKYGADQIFNKKVMKPFVNKVSDAVLAEGFTEGFQAWYQNIIKKYGYDETQELLEGVLESVISGGLGGGAISVVDAGYVRLQEARGKLKEKGATDEELDLIQEEYARELSNHRDTIEPMFQSKINESLASLDKFIEENKDEAAVAQALAKKKELEDIYNDSYNELVKIVPEEQAKSNAALIRNSAFFFSEEFGISPKEYVARRGVKVQKSDRANFDQRPVAAEESYGPLMQVTQRDINWAKAHPEWKSNARIINMIGQAGADINDSLDNINKALKEYSIKEYKHAKKMEVAEFNRRARELSEDLQERYAMMVENGVSPQEAYNAVTYVEDYIPFQSGIVQQDDKLINRTNKNKYLTDDEVIEVEKDAKNFATKVEALERGDLPAREQLMVLNRLPSAYNKIKELKGRRLFISQDIYKKIVDIPNKYNKNHNVSRERAIKLPELVADPNYILQSTSEGHEDRFVIVTNSKGKKWGTRLSVIIQPSSRDAIVSAYDENINISEEKKAGRVYYDKKKELESEVSALNAKGLTSSNTSIVSPNRENVNRIFYQESLNIAQENAELDKVNPAYEGETININGVERTVYNSNGDRIAMSEPALRNFYNWFGDSKVVNEQGRPLVVYHNTDKDIKAFDINKARATMDIQGIFFAPKSDPYKEYGPIEYPVYLKIENPVDYAQAYEGFDMSVEGAGIRQREKLQSQGYDGAILTEDGVPYEYIAFCSNQIKSTSNRGTYSESDNIYYQSAFAGSRVDYNQPSLEAIGSGEGAQVHGWGLYYALKRAVAERYRKAFIRSERETVFPDSREEVAIETYLKNNKDKQATIKELSQMEKEAQSKLGTPEEDVLAYVNISQAVDYMRYIDDATLEQQTIELENSEKGQVHEVDIPDYPYLLDEDLSYSQQPEIVKTAINDIINELTDEQMVKVTLDPHETTEEKREYLRKALTIDGAGYDINVHADGRGIYKALSKMLGSDKAASQMLEKHGVKGISYYGRDDGYCFVIFNPDDVKVIQKFYQDSTNGAQGAYVNGIIHLFENANASTIPHELAHYWKDMLHDAAQMSKRAQKMLDDVAKWSNEEFNRKYAIQKKGSQYYVINKQGLTVYGDENRLRFFTEADAKNYAQEELFAQGFETYLKEGKAPNKSMKQAFRNFLMWLKHIYKQAMQLDIRLSPDIRNVYADILGGADIDFFLKTDPDTFIENRIKLANETEGDIDQQIAEAQIKGIVRSKAKRALKDFGKYWQDAVVPLSTRLKRINPKLRTKIRRHEFNVVNNLNKYYQEVKPFLDIWQKFSEADAIAFDIALKNDYVKKQLEIVDKYGAREEWEKVHKTLLDIYDNGISAGLDINYRPDYFPRDVEDYDGFMAYMQGRPDWSVFEQALKEADPEGKYSIAEKAEFINKYFRGFVKADIMPSKFGSEKQRKIDHVTNEMNQYYKLSIEALIGYIEGMNARIEASKFLGKDVENLDSSIGGFIDYLLVNKEIENKDVDTVKRILKARFSQKGVGNKFIAGMRDVSYLYTMGGINSAITQIEDISVSLYENGLKNTFKAAVKKKDIKRSDLGLEKIGQEFIDNPSKTAAAVDWTFKATGLDKIDAWGKETFVNAKIAQYEQMSDKELREYIEPIIEQDTNQVIKDIRNGVRSDDVLFLAYNELSNYQPISLSELPAYYNVGGNWRVVYMLKSFMLKRIDIFRNECYDKIFGDTDTKTKIEGVQNLFRLAILMVMCGVTKDWLINMLYGRNIDLPEMAVNNLLGLAGISKFHLYQARDKGIEDVIKDFLFPPILAPWHDFGNDISKFVRGKTNIKDFEVAKGIPLFGRFYYWWVGRGKEKMKKRGSKLK